MSPSSRLDISRSYILKPQRLFKNSEPLARDKLANGNIPDHKEALSPKENCPIYLKNITSVISELKLVREDNKRSKTEPYDQRCSSDKEKRSYHSRKNNGSEHCQNNINNLDHEILRRLKVSLPGKLEDLCTHRNSQSTPIIRSVTMSLRQNSYRQLSDTKIFLKYLASTEERRLLKKKPSARNILLTDHNTNGRDTADLPKKVSLAKDLQQQQRKQQRSVHTTTLSLEEIVLSG